MKNPEHPFHIAQLILKSLNGELNEAEKSRLDDWLLTETNRKLYESLITRDLKMKKIMSGKLHPEKSWKQLEKQIHFHRKSRHLHFARYAAAILLLGILSTTIYLIRNRPQEIIQLAQETEPIPGSAKALLIMESGQKIHLETNQYFLAGKDSTIKLNNEDNTLKIEPQQITSSSVESYQTLSVPIGGEYKLILSDGTTIWLNADTRIRFPLFFTDNKRVVYLEGEAYFEVAHRPEQPFIVSVKNMKVEVLGTKFNVKAYSNEPAIYTTLAEGRVKTQWIQSETAMFLSPNQQCIFTKSDGQMQKKEVNAHTYTGWTQGKFIFENETLEEIMNQLGRWYDTKVIYSKPEIKNYRFTGYVDRFEQISTLLEMIEKTYNITFNIQGKNIIIN